MGGNGRWLPNKHCNPYHPPVIMAYGLLYKVFVYFDVGTYQDQAVNWGRGVVGSQEPPLPKRSGSSKDNFVAVLRCLI